ncbi:general odorant-binding protein 66-like [Armigeres subalbatus]|uniref:general odorant-binding protein 66-like n=1 Tax=Armigeres subalbatus TaxID=124917 RepID=UPI002ED04716
MKTVIVVAFICKLLQQSIVTGEDNACKNGPPVNKGLWDCCNMPNLIDQDIRTECQQKYGEQTVKQAKLEGTPRGCCIAECQLNATGLYADGMVDREAMTSMFMDAVKDAPEWQPKVRDLLDECFRRAEANKDVIAAGAMLEPSFEGEKICHPISGAIMRCMNKNLYVMCPMENYYESPECNQLMDFYRMCNGQ